MSSEQFNDEAWSEIATNLGLKNLTAKTNQADSKTIKQVFDSGNRTLCDGPGSR